MQDGKPLKLEIKRKVGMTKNGAHNSKGPKDFPLIRVSVFSCAVPAYGDTAWWQLMHTPLYTQAPARFGAKLASNHQQGAPGTPARTKS